MKYWIGKALVGIGAIHTVFGLVFFYKQWLVWLQEGLWNTVHMQADREWAFWFIAIGCLAMLLGFLTDWAEKQVGYLPSLFGWLLLLFSVIGVVLMPISGIWLIFLTSVGAVWAHSKHVKDSAYETLEEVRV